MEQFVSAHLPLVMYKLIGSTRRMILGCMLLVRSPI